MHERPPHTHTHTPLIHQYHRMSDQKVLQRTPFYLIFSTCFAASSLSDPRLPTLSSLHFTFYSFYFSFFFFFLRKTTAILSSSGHSFNAEKGLQEDGRMCGVGVVCVRCVLVLGPCGGNLPWSFWCLTFGSLGIKKERRCGRFDWGEREVS